MQKTVLKRGVILFLTLVVFSFALFILNGVNAAALLSLSANPTSINPGQSSTLSWSSSGAVECQWTLGLSGPASTSGTKSVSPTTTTTYEMTCYDSFDNPTSAQETVTVNTPTVSLSANPTSINPGQSSTLSWTSSNADSCRWTEGPAYLIGPTTLSGTISVSPTTTTTYELTCTNIAGSTSRSATVSVTSTTYTLSIDISGIGTVYDAVSGKSCSSSTSGGCTWTLPKDQKVELSTNPIGGQITGACTGTTSCSFFMTSNKLVFVSFPSSCDVNSCGPGGGTWYCDSGTSRKKWSCSTGSCVSQSENCLDIDSNYECYDSDGTSGPNDAICRPTQPTLSCSASPLDGKAPLTVSFTVGSTPSGGSCSLYFGDGGILNTVCPSLYTTSYKYSQAGTYSPTYSKDGTTALAQCGTITVTNPDSQPQISLTPTSLSYGQVATGQSKSLPITVTNTGGGTLSGSASVTGTGFACTSGCSYSLASGQSQTVTITFTPTTAQSYTGTASFSGTGASNTPQTAQLSGTGVFALTVSKSGSGSGTVTSNPSGINCGTDCSEYYSTSGTSVTLTASASTGSTFSGWSGGGCSGTGTCTVTMNQNRDVTATFTSSTGGGGGGSGWSCINNQCQVVNSGAQYSTQNACLQSCGTGNTPQCGNGIIEGTEQCDDGDTSSGDGCSSTCQVESGWTCNGQPSVCVQQSQCLNIGLCQDYTNPTQCNADACSVGDNSAPSTINCAAQNTSCGCSWDSATATCGFSYTQSNSNGNFGQCRITQDTTDDCSDGFLSYNWTGVWIGDDIPSERAKCEQGGIDTIPCPAKIQLPFFTTYNVIAIIAVAVLIYLIISMKKSPKKRKKR